METVIRPLIEQLNTLEPEARIEAINQVKVAMHEVSPLKGEPVDCVLWVKNDRIEANDYNPNIVAPPEMTLLQISIESDGYTQPIVTWPENNHFTVVDGFHRNRVGKECEAIRNKLFGYLPITIIREEQTERGDRIASTIRHNRARGKHRIEGMSNIVIELKRRNWSDAKIGRELGMDPDEVLRLTQISGLAEMFQDREFSEAWEAENVLTINEDDNLHDIEPEKVESVELDSNTKPNTQIPMEMK